jgi:hypothetical protein
MSGFHSCKNNVKTRVYTLSYSTITDTIFSGYILGRGKLQYETLLVLLTVFMHECDSL